MRRLTHTLGTGTGGCDGELTAPLPLPLLLLCWLLRSALLWLSFAALRTASLPLPAATLVRGLATAAAPKLRKTTQLKQLITTPGQLGFLMEAHNGLSAKIVEEAGFKAIWGSGLSISAAMGVRDSNEASWTQVGRHRRRRHAAALPPFEWPAARPSASLNPLPSPPSLYSYVCARRCWRCASS